MRKNEVKRYLAGYIRMLLAPAARISALDVHSKMHRVTLTLLARCLEKACAGNAMLSDALKEGKCGLVSDRSCASSIPEYTFHSEIGVVDNVPVCLNRAKFDDGITNAVNLLVKSMMHVCLDSETPVFVSYTFLEHMICTFDELSRMYDTDTECAKSCMLSSAWCDLSHMMSTVVDPDVGNMFDDDYAGKSEFRALEMHYELLTTALDKPDKIIE